MKLRQLKRKLGKSRKPRKPRKPRRRRSRKTELAGGPLVPGGIYFSDSSSGSTSDRTSGSTSASASGSRSGTWSKGKKSFELESFGSGRSSSAPLLGRNPSGTGRNIKAFEEKQRLKAERIELEEAERIAQVKAQEQAKRAKLLSKNLKRFDTLVKGTTLKELKAKERKVEETKAKEKKDETEAKRLRKWLKGRVRSHWDLDAMNLSQLQKLEKKVDEANYYNYVTPN